MCEMCVRDVKMYCAAADAVTAAVDAVNVPCAGATWP